LQDRALLWKLDLRLIPWLCLLYLISFLDRTNIGNARLDHLESTLHITGGQYNAALSIFFVSYSLAEPLTNVLLKRLRPSIFIPSIMILWGICMTTMGLVHNFQGLMTARFFLGLAEAGLFPGITYYLSCWYRRCEFGVRAAIFFSAAAVSGSFGGLLAAAIGKMDGVGGKRGWSWIFIIEGIATVIISIASFWMVYDFPDEATFLTDADRQRVLRRLKADQQSSAEHEEFRMTYLWASVRDWKTWLGAVVYMGADGPLYAFSLFLPSIIAAVSSSVSQSIGLYTDTSSARLQVDHSTASFRSTLCSRCNSHHHDRFHCRQNAPTWPLQHRLLPPWRGRILHAFGWHQPSGSVRRDFPRRSGHLPLHCEHGLLGQQQHRRCLQERRDARNCDWMGESQRGHEL